MYRLCILLVCAQGLVAGSLQDSKEPDERQKVNFCGLLKSVRSEHPRSVENIGMPSYKKIKFYVKPTKDSDEPGKDVYTGNLKDIAKIERLSAREKELPEFRKRKYVEIKITFNDAERSSRTYIVEANRRVTYHEIIDGKVIPLHTDFSEVESLEIKGHFERSEDKKEDEGKRCKMLLNK